MIEIKERYTVILMPRDVFDVEYITNEFRTGYIGQLGIFKPEITFSSYSLLALQTISGNDVMFKQDSFHFSFQGSLYYDNILKSIKATVELTKKLESLKLSFNPNLITLSLGHFEWEEAFIKDFGDNARKLQEISYKGGNALYYQSSNSFELFLGTEQEIGKMQNLGGVKKLEFEGTPQPANSLDELLVRIEQNQ